MGFGPRGETCHSVRTNLSVIIMSPQTMAAGNFGIGAVKLCALWAGG